MKKTAVFLVIIQILLISSGCNYDLYYGKRPFDYGTAKWICEEPSIWFAVDRDAADYYYPKGEIRLNDRTIKVGFRFVHSTKHVFVDLITEKTSSVLDASNNITGYYELFEGECVFFPEKFTIKIDHESDTLFEGKYETITFIRFPIEE